MDRAIAIFKGGADLSSSLVMASDAVHNNYAVEGWLCPECASKVYLREEHCRMRKNALQYVPSLFYHPPAGHGEPDCPLRTYNDSEIERNLSPIISPINHGQRLKIFNNILYELMFRESPLLKLDTPGARIARGVGQNCIDSNPASSEWQRTQKRFSRYFKEVGLRKLMADYAQATLKDTEQWISEPVNAIMETTRFFHKQVPRWKPIDPGNIAALQQALQMSPMKQWNPEIVRSAGEYAERMILVHGPDGAFLHIAEDVQAVILSMPRNQLGAHYFVNSEINKWLLTSSAIHFLDRYCATYLLQFMEEYELILDYLLACKSHEERQALIASVTKQHIYQYIEMGAKDASTVLIDHLNKATKLPFADLAGLIIYMACCNLILQVSVTPWTYLMSNSELLKKSQKSADRTNRSGIGFGKAS